MDDIERSTLLNTLLGPQPRFSRSVTPDSAQYESRYQEMGPWRRARAGIANILGSVPLIRSIPGVSSISTPEDLQVARGARPGLSTFENMYGHTAPYIATGASIPGLFSSLPRAMFTSGAIEGTDAGLTGGNVPQAISQAVLSSIPGPVLGRLITPRSASEVFSSRFNSAIERADRVRQAMRDINAISYPGHWSTSAMRYRGNTLAPDTRMAVRDTFNAGLSHTPPITHPYMNNTLLGDDSRSLLNALLSGYTQETIGGM